nr:MAG: ORF1 [TTV-like mini virus]
MPYWRYYRSRWRPRRRWRRRRFTRRPFQRRLWRRRHRRVRKRKLKKIKITQWQPQFIKKMKIVGTEPLFLTTSERLTNNFVCYKDSTAPEHVPGGGGFSIMNFTLNALYEKHMYLENWWTTSNDNMPLIRFTGVTLYYYRQSEFDYLTQYVRQYPMNASLLKYTSTHPQAMLLHKNTLKITCKRNNRNKKPYKKLKIKPPSQMYNHWYFQKDIAHVPLLQLITTAASLDRMFLNSNSLSSTIGFTSLDQLGFLNHNYTKEGTQGYVAKPGQLLFGIHQGKYNIKTVKFSELIYMGNAVDLTEGTEAGHITANQYNTITGTAYNTTIKKQLKYIQQTPNTWGNPFNDAFHRTGGLITTSLAWEQIIGLATSDNTTLTDAFTWKTTFTFPVRYNPFADKGVGNKLYLIKWKDAAHDTDWDTPIPETLYENLPLWLMFWGYLDYFRKSGDTSTLDTTALIVIKTNYTFPKDKKLLIPLDQDFLEGRSPYMEQQETTASDRQNWHPKVRFQIRTANLIGSCGPGTIKLPPQQSAEAHLKYVFHFKLGGTPPPMATLTEPDKQPKYTTPDNVIQTPSLQSPTSPFEYILYNFDERRGTLTKKAAERITKYKETEQTVLPFTESALSCYTTPQEKTQTSETSDEEKEEMSLQEQLQLQRKQQRLLRKRINELLNRLTLLE